MSIKIIPKITPEAKEILLASLKEDKKYQLDKPIPDFKDEKERINWDSPFYLYVRDAVINARPNYIDGEHIKRICNEVYYFVKDPNKDILIVSTPPRHMKSTIISESFPVYFLSNRPQEEVIIGSYNQTQARKLCRACRLQFETDKHKEIFDTFEFEEDTADEFMFKGKLNGRPSLISAGVGSGLTGSGASLIILDDTVKDYKDATSSVIRENIIEWYQSVVVTRLAPQGKTILVQTRWHYHDLPGVVMEEGDRSRMTVINMPAFDDKGEPLWPERYGKEELNKIRSRLRSTIWNALYMGRPTPAEGGMFKRQWIKTTNQPFPANASRVRYWDKAATHADGDWTVGTLMAEMDGRFCIEDVRRIQGSPAEVQALIRSTAMADGTNVAIRMEQEPGSSGVEVIDLYARRILMGFDFRQDKVTGPKEIRANALAAAMENGNVELMTATWNRAFIDELAEFPLGEHDDQVDSASGAFNSLTLNSTTDNVWFV